MVVLGQQRGRLGSRAAQGDILGPRLFEGVWGERGQVGKVDQLPFPAPALVQLLRIIGQRTESVTTIVWRFLG